MPTPPANATTSSFHLGTYNTQTDSFTQVLDLNDGATFRIHPKSLKLAQPDKTIVETGNIRAPGASVARWQYKNRHIQVEVSLRGNSTSALLASLRALLAAVEQPPYSIRLALPGATQYSYADVVAVKHDIPSDTQQILAGAITRIHMDFECRPGLRGDRITLSNLALNPGFEAPSGAGVAVFFDSFANTNAYSLVSGSAPSVAAGVMTIPSGTTLQFGSPAWGPVNIWQMRLQTPSVAWDLHATLHVTDPNNVLFCNFFSTGIEIHQTIDGVDHLQGSASFGALSNSTWYWLTFTQFPAAPGFVADVQVSVNADSAGSIGALIATTGPINTFNGITALSGRMQLFASTGAWGISSNVVQLFGPGGWTSVQNGGTGRCAFAWEQNSANTYPSGPVTSFGAGRIDLPPAGTVNAYWTNYNGGSPIGTPAMPVAGTPNTFGVSCRVKTSGVGAGCTTSLYLSEYDFSGNFLRQTLVQQVVGVVGWTTLSGSVVTGANTSYASVWLLVVDSSAGASANGTIWFDNVQVWNQTTTGQTSMPYCELRFYQGPSSLVVSGLQGDMVAPALCSLGLPVTSWGPGSTITYAVGRRPLSTPGWRGVGNGHGQYASSASPQATAILDSGSYGGYYAKATLATKFESPAFSPLASDATGIYQLWHRFQTSQTTVANVTNRVNVEQKTAAWFQADASASDVLGSAFAPFGPTISAANTWTLCNAGLAALPPFAINPTADLSKTYIVPLTQMVDTTNNGATGSENWQALIPVDGALVTGIANNPSNGGRTITNTFWLYLDGLGEPVSSGPLDRVSPYAVTWSIESGPLPNPSGAGGGVGNQSTGFINVNSSADPYLTLDPTLDTGSGAAQIGVNQLVAFMATGAATISPLYCEMAYSPLYLYPR